MSRHLWKGSRPRPERSSSTEPELPYLGIFAATLRAVKGLTGRPTVDPDPMVDPSPESPSGIVALHEVTAQDDATAQQIPLSKLGATEVPLPRTASPPAAFGVTGSPQPGEQPAGGTPPFEDAEPAEPALAMISRGRHGLW